MVQTIRKAWGIPELRKKIVFTLLMMLIFRIGNAIPVPYVDTNLLETYIQQMSTTVLGLYNVMSGGAFAQATIFALGVQPYINSSIIIQLLTVAIPALERLAREGGEEGKKKIQSITRYTTVAIAVLQGWAYYMLMKNNYGILTNDSIWAALVIIVSFIAGSCFVMWMGEQITEFGIGNGISMILFAGILSRVPTMVSSMIQSTVSGTIAWWMDVLLVVGILVLFVLVVFVSEAERRIPVQYAKQVKGRKMYGGQSTVIPIKISGSGVMPLIFAFAIISLPDLVMGLFFADSTAYSNYQEWFSSGTGTLGWLYILILCLLIFLFSFFYAQIQFNPEDISKSIQQNGGFIPGIRPGRPTADYLKKISNRITLFGAIFLSLVAFIPTLVFSFIGNSDLLSVFSTTGILIVVSVALEFDKQLQSQLMMKNYKGFLK